MNRAGQQMNYSCQSEETRKAVQDDVREWFKYGKESSDSAAIVGMNRSPENSGNDVSKSHGHEAVTVQTGRRG